MDDHDVSAVPVPPSSRHPTDAELAEVVALHLKAKAMLEDPLELARALVRVLEDRRRRQDPAPEVQGARVQVP
jgi:hypothetical protein